MLSQIRPWGPAPDGKKARQGRRSRTPNNPNLRKDTCPWAREEKEEKQNSPALVESFPSNGKVEVVQRALQMEIEERYRNLKDAFIAADSDRSGKLEANELIRLCAMNNLPQDTVLALVDRCDIDKDGRMSYEEFAAGPGQKSYTTTDQLNALDFKKRLVQDLIAQGATDDQINAALAEYDSMEANSTQPTTNAAPVLAARRNVVKPRGGEGVADMFAGFSTLSTGRQVQFSFACSGTQEEGQARDRP